MWKLLLFVTTEIMGNILYFYVYSSGTEAETTTGGGEIAGAGRCPTHPGRAAQPVRTVDWGS